MGGNGLDPAAIIDEAFEFDHLRDEIKVNSEVIGTNHGLYLKSDPGVTSFKCGGRCRSDRKGACAARGCSGQRILTEGIAAAKGLRNLGRLKLCGITKFTHDFDHSTLSALCRHARRGKNIDSLLLIESANNDLKLGISKYAA